MSRDQEKEKQRKEGITERKADRLILANKSFARCAGDVIMANHESSNDCLKSGPQSR